MPGFFLAPDLNPGQEGKGLNKIFTVTSFPITILLTLLPLIVLMGSLTGTSL